MSHITRITFTDTTVYRTTDNEPTELIIHHYKPERKDFQISFFNTLVNK